MHIFSPTFCSPGLATCNGGILHVHQLFFPACVFPARTVARMPKQLIASCNVRVRGQVEDMSAHSRPSALQRDRLVMQSGPRQSITLILTTSSASKRNTVSSMNSTAGKVGHRSAEVYRRTKAPASLQPPPPLACFPPGRVITSPHEVLCRP